MYNQLAYKGSFGIDHKYIWVFFKKKNLDLKCVTLETPKPSCTITKKRPYSPREKEACGRARNWVIVEGDQRGGRALCMCVSEREIRERAMER